MVSETSVQYTNSNTELVKIQSQLQRLILHEEGQSFGIANARSEFKKSKNFLTQSVVADALKGNQTISVFLSDSNTLTKSCCIDFDSPRDAETLQELSEILKKIKQTLATHGIHSYIEFSGNRGYHLWIFFNRLLTSEFALKLMHSVAIASKLNLKVWEFFPDKIVESHGIKMPYTFNKKTNKRCGFVVEGDFSKDISLEGAGDLLATFQQNPFEILKEFCSHFQPPKEINQEIKEKDFSLLKGDHPACIKHLVRYGAPLDLDYNRCNMNIGAYSINNPFMDEKSAFELAESMAINTSLDHSTSKSTVDLKLSNFRSTFESLKRGDYKFQCGCILANVEKNAYKKRGCTGKKCPLYEKKEFDQNGVNAEYDSDLIPLNTLIFKAINELRLEDDQAEISLIQLWQQVETALKKLPPTKDILVKSVPTSDVHIENLTLKYLIKNYIPIENQSQYYLEKGYEFVAEIESIHNHLKHIFEIDLISEDDFYLQVNAIENKGLNKAITSELKSLAEGKDVTLKLNALKDFTEKIDKFLGDEPEDFTSDSVLDSLLQDFDEPPKFMPSFSTDLNRILNGGFYAKRLYSLMAVTGNGKTTFLTSLACFLASKGKRVFYAPFEMDSKEILVTQLSRIARVDSTKITRREWLAEFLSESEKRTLRNKINQASAIFKETIAENLILPSCDLSFTPTKIKKLVKQYQCDILIIDYLQLMQTGEKAFDHPSQDTARISRLINELKAIAIELEIPVIIVLDTNKEGFKKANSGGGLSMDVARDSIRIAFGVDVFMTLESKNITVGSGNEKQDLNVLNVMKVRQPKREKYLAMLQEKFPLKDELSDTYANIEILKNRAGILGDCQFIYSKAINTFTPINLNIDANYGGEI